MDSYMVNLPETVSVAILVIAGAFGNGDERKTALTKAGYNPTKVQSCVNDLVPVINKYKGV